MRCNTETLKRVSIGKLNLGDLKLGEWRYLTPDEIKKATELY
jgi:16S rRNA U516 pseudouridylate synthase RsuA-like enzyme